MTPAEADRLKDTLTRGDLERLRDAALKRRRKASVLVKRSQIANQRQAHVPTFDQPEQ